MPWRQRRCVDCAVGAHGQYVCRTYGERTARLADYVNDGPSTWRPPGAIGPRGGGIWSPLFRTPNRTPIRDRRRPPAVPLSDRRCPVHPRHAPRAGTVGGVWASGGAVTMSNEVLMQLRPEWRAHFCDVGRAVLPFTSRPARLRVAVSRWSTLEPELAGVSPGQLFGRSGSFDDPQLRALIRIARSEDADADMATWTVICQFLPAVQSIARTESRRQAGGSEGPRAAVNTAIAELWRQVHHINLDSNRASIFYALAAPARRAVIPAVHGITPADRLMASLVDPVLFGSGVAHRPGPSWREDHATDRELEATEWHVTCERLVEQLTDFLTEDMILYFGWDRRRSCFAGRQAILRAYLRARLTAAAEGSPIVARRIAQSIGAPLHAVRSLHTDVGRALTANSDRYREHILATLNLPDAEAGNHRAPWADVA